MKKKKKPIKSGILKHDLYHLSDDEFDYNDFPFPGDIMTDREIDHMIEQVKLLREKCEKVPKGTKFFCFPRDKKEWFAEVNSWYTNRTIGDTVEYMWECEGYEVSGIDGRWDKKHLTDIEVLN